MMRVQIKLMIFVGIVALLSLSCDGLFPTQSKPTLPSDHTVNRSGAQHKPGLEVPLGRGGCGTAVCHGPDLKGGVAEVNGQKTIAPSCTQCHGTLWGDGGGDGED